MKTCFRTIQIRSTGWKYWEILKARGPKKIRNKSGIVFGLEISQNIIFFSFFNYIFHKDYFINSKSSALVSMLLNQVFIYEVIFSTFLNSFLIWIGSNRSGRAREAGGAVGTVSSGCFAPNSTSTFSCLMWGCGIRGGN